MQMSIEVKPISEAPKDGKEVIFKTKNDSILVAYWDDNACFGQGVVGPGWQVWYCDNDPWYSCAVDGSYFTGFLDI